MLRRLSVLHTPLNGISDIINPVCNCLAYYTELNIYYNVMELYFQLLDAFP